jgi:peptidoglycan/LPS O-acetylase OafA/YrhL
VGAPSRGSTPAVGSGTGTRRDIQGLRAVAVAAVVAFHLWPGAVTGGYVGVDVFFVISGFLITSHLLRRPVDGVAGLLEFWARRVRRLIPAASLVLLVTLVASVVWLPSTVQSSVAREVAASALYVENWALAASEADYLAADQLHSPVQHYWSLSIEEQFYLLWPVLLGAATWAGWRIARRRAARPDAGHGGLHDQAGRTTASARVAVVVTGVVVAASLGWSVHLTAADPAAAYFVSTTRFWELGIGGLLAAVLAARAARPGPVAGRAVRGAEMLRAVAAWAGLVMIAWSVATFDAATPFPGTAALLPTLGTALVIAAGSDDVRGGPVGLLGLRPVRWLGDASYSVYLWHWPLVVITPFALGAPLTPLGTVGVLAVTLALSALSRTWVEERLRRHPLLERGRGATFVALAVCVGVVAGAGAAVAVRADAVEREQAATFAQQVADAEPCVGAGVVRDPSCATPEFLTPPQVAAEDKPVVYADGCWNNTPFTSRNTCTYGPDEPDARIALVGNSHAGHWVPALEDAIRTDRWELTTYLQSVCYTVDRMLEIDGEGVAQNCRDTNRWAVDSVVSGGYDLVILSDRTHQPLAGVPADQQAAAAQEAYRETLAAFTDAGIPVLVLRDTPAMPGNVPDCVAEHPDDVDACGAPPAVALEPDPLAAAAAADTTGLVSAAEVTDVLCDDALCRPVVGGLIAYFDHGHLTATFARTLAPEVAGAVRERLGG